MKCIFFGAGNYAKLNILKWIRQDIIPICFVDNDKNKQGNYIDYCLEDGFLIEILSYQDAILKYGEHDFFISTDIDKWKEITQFLIQMGVQLDRIHIPNDAYEYRKGCFDMGHSIVVRDTISMCCWPVFSEKLQIKMSGDINEDFIHYEEAVIRNIRKWRKGEKTSCDQCHNLVYDYWEKNPSPCVLNFSSAQNHDFCNARCSYCKTYPMPKKDQYEKRGIQVSNIIDAFRKRYPESKAHVVVSAGEIAVSAFKKELINKIIEYDYSADIMSNSIVYSEEISKLLSIGKAKYTTTLDSTIEKKYAEIKGVNCLQQVLTNVRRYSLSTQRADQIQIKIVLMDGMYDSVKELHGVVDFVKEINGVFLLSCDKFNKDKEFSAKMLWIVFELLSYCLKNEIIPNVMLDHFNNNDANMIKRYLDILLNNRKCSLAKNISKVENIEKVYYDRFLKYAFCEFDCKSFDENTYNAVILRYIHIIEKGLSMTNYRYGSGKEAFITLMDILINYKNDFGNTSEIYKAGIEILKKYIIKNKQEDSSLEILLEMEPFIELADDNLVGVISIKKNVLPASSSLDYKNFVESRHSVRHFSTASVSIDIIKQAFEIATHTPTACNRQGQRCYIIRDKNKIKFILKNQNGNNGFTNEIDTLIVVVYDLKYVNVDREVYQGWIDGGMYMMNLLYSFHYVGLASVPLSGSLYFEQEKMVRECLNMSDSEILIGFIALGNYPDEYLVTKSLRIEPNFTII